MIPRPKSITVIAWIIIITNTIILLFNSISFYPNQELLSNDKINSIQYLISTNAILLFNIITGIALRRRKNWARYTFLIIGIINITLMSILYIVQNHHLPLIGIILFIVMIRYLFSPEADSYFKNSPLAPALIYLENDHF